jgi:hypothetical protein
MKGMSAAGLVNKYSRDADSKTTNKKSDCISHMCGIINAECFKNDIRMKKQKKKMRQAYPVWIGSIDNPSR